MTIPDELTPDDHVVIGGPQGSHRFEIEIEECSHSPEVFVKGLTPPGYTPRVAEAEPPGAYTVKKSGSPNFSSMSPSGRVPVRTEIMDGGASTSE